MTWIFCCCGLGFLVLTFIRSEVRVPVTFEEDKPVLEDCCADVGCDDESPFETAGGCRAVEVVVCGLSEATPPGSVGVGTRLLLLEPV